MLMIFSLLLYIIRYDYGINTSDIYLDITEKIRNIILIP